MAAANWKNLTNFYHFLIWGTYVSTVLYDILLIPLTTQEKKYGGRFQYLTFIDLVSTDIWCWPLFFQRAIPQLSSAVNNSDLLKQNPTPWSARGRSASQLGVGVSQSGAPHLRRMSVLVCFEWNYNANESQWVSNNLSTRMQGTATTDAKGFWKKTFGLGSFGIGWSVLKNSSHPTNN